MKTGEELSDQRPSSRSRGVRCSGLNSAALATRAQKTSSAARAPGAPPSAQPSASTAAFMAPAEVPEIASIRSHDSSSRRSRTPQVKAPCEPPPCSAKSTRSGSRSFPVLTDVRGIYLPACSCDRPRFRSTLSIIERCTRDGDLGPRCQGRHVSRGPRNFFTHHSRATLVSGLSDRNLITRKQGAYGIYCSPTPCRQWMTPPPGASIGPTHDRRPTVDAPSTARRGAARRSSRRRSGWGRQ